MLVIGGPFSRIVEIINISKECHAATVWINIKSDFFGSPFDCGVLSATLVAITDIHEKESKVHIINTEKRQVVDTLCKSMFFTAIFPKDQSIIISDHKDHCLYEYNIDEKTLALLLEDSGK